MTEFDFDRERGWVWLRVTGALKQSATLAMVRDLVRDPRFTTGMNGMVDLRGVGSLELFGDDVRAGAELVVRLGDAFVGSRWAVVATSDPIFGIARQFELMVSDDRFEVRAFRDFEQARRFLERAD